MGTLESQSSPNLTLRAGQGNRRREVPAGGRGKLLAEAEDDLRRSQGFWLEQRVEGEMIHQDRKSGERPDEDAVILAFGVLS